MSSSQEFAMHECKRGTAEHDAEMPIPAAAAAVNVAELPCLIMLSST
jgi:hypothetical protein